MIIPEPSIHILGIRIDEPVVTLTDLLVTGVSLFAYFQLLRRPAERRIHHYLRFFFLGMALSTAMGGMIGHGFFYLFSPPWQLPGWLAGMIAIAFLELSSIHQASGLLRPGLSKFLIWLVIIELVSFIVLSITTIDFIFVVIHIAFGLLIIVAPLQLFLRIHNNNPGTTWFLVAVGIIATSVPFFINQWIIHQWFNHVCICHTLIAVSMWFFYKGAVKIANGS